MKNKRKQMLMASVAMLVIASISMASTTYAWFTKSNTSQLSGVEFTAETAGGIDMSFDATTWRSNLTPTDFPTEASDGGLIASGINGKLSGNTSMSPVSCNGVVSAGALALFKGEVNDNKTEITASGASTANGYYAFNLYFRNTGNTARDLYLDLSNVSDSTYSSEVKVPAGVTSTGIEYATRVAFLVNGSVSAGTANIPTILAKLDATSAKIWEPNADTHTAYAIANRGATAGTVITSYTAMKTTGVYDYSGDIAVARSGAGQTDTVSGHLQTNATASTSASTDYKVTTIAANSISKVTVYIWIEGQDVDCNNAQSGGQVSTKLCFYANAAASN